MENECSSEKKTWEKPELTVLVRSNPEEAVLGACKQSAIPWATSNFDGNCYAPPTCVTCVSFAPS